MFQTDLDRKRYAGARSLALTSQDTHGSKQLSWEATIQQNFGGQITLAHEDGSTGDQRLDKTASTR